MDKEIKLLINKALEARENSYCPYSNYAVGAALLTDSSLIFTGCNIENASYGATNCAERTAVFNAISAGHKKIKMIAICGGMKEGEMGMAYPCGVCRQVLREFSNPDELIVIVAKSESCYEKFRLSELLPNSFGPDFRD